MTEFCDTEDCQYNDNGICKKKFATVENSISFRKSSNDSLSRTDEKENGNEKN